VACNWIPLSSNHSKGLYSKNTAHHHVRLYCQCILLSIIASYDTMDGCKTPVPHCQSIHPTMLISVGNPNAYTMCMCVCVWGGAAALALAFRSFTCRPLCTHVLLGYHYHCVQSIYALRYCFRNFRQEECNIINKQNLQTKEARGKNPYTYKTQASPKVVSSNSSTKMFTPNVFLI